MRTARIHTPGILYHLISRFVDRGWFITSRDQRRFYLRLLGNALETTDWRCLSYAIMSSHIHLGVVAGVMPMAGWLRAVHAPFAVAMNSEHERIGPLFVRGPKDNAVAPEKEAAVLAYIHNNPVRARVVASAGDSDWTSHQAYLGRVPRPPWLHVDEGLARAGTADGAAFGAWVAATPGESGAVDLRGMRAAARMRGAIEVATPTAGAIPTVPLVGRRTALVRADPREIVKAVLSFMGLTLEELGSRRRARSIVVARRTTVQTAKRLGVTGAEIAAALGISEQAVSQLTRVELPADQRRVIEEIRARIAAGRLATRHATS